jgi:manganese/iron transport system permease protein
VATAVGIAFLSRRGRISSDTAIGVLFAGAFSLGIVIMSQVRTYTTDLFAFVFGNVLGVGADDLLLIGLVGAAVLAVIVALYKELLFTAFDPVMAEASGLPVPLLQYLLLVLIGVTVVVAMKAIGIVLVVAMLVTPAATASMLTHRFGRIMLVAAGISLLAAFAGLYLSFYANVPSGAAIVLVNTAVFLIVLALGPRAGWRRGQVLEPEPSSGG